MILIHKGGESSDPTQFRMISLTLNIAKLYHTLEAQRTLNFMTANNYLDATSQKAFFNGINGCAEHIEVVQEVIQHARLNHKTVYITWFDLADAFGSVCHDMIPICMRHYNIPEEIVQYIINIYSKLEGRVVTKDWETDKFSFRREVFQVDPYSVAAFLIIFNPIVSVLNEYKEKYGYKLDDMFISATPFADDFDIISRNKIHHQKTINDIEEKITSMGLVLKPYKCR